MQNRYSKKFLKYSTEPLKSPFPSMLQTFFFTQKRLKGPLFTRMAHGHSKDAPGTRVILAFMHLRDWVLKGHLVTEVT